MSLLKITLVLAVLVIASNAQSGHYWRDYKGELPDDALPGGTDDKGRTIYIGQAVHDTPLPGTIRPEQKQISYEFGNKEYLTLQNVKILCSLYPKRFKWLKTSNGNSASALSTNGTNLIPAGSDGGRHLVVGRISLSEQEVLIGKVLVTNETFNGIWISKNGNGWYQSSYEVLLYDSNIPAKGEMVCRKTPVVINLYQ